uniref:UDP-N-acetylglucosamine diphosphorylase n=1 Tax=Dunaliella tertiolecta TaxID=3047 RepID=A0A7S3R5M6_DUNTE
MVITTDIAGLGALGYAVYQVAGEFYRFRAKSAKRKEQLGPFDKLHQELRKQRRTADLFGSGAQASGQSHVTAGWERLSADARIGLVEDLLRVAVLTGQLKHVKAVREGRTQWSQLKEREKSEVLMAVDAVRLDTLGAQVKAQGSKLAKSWLWQVTEPVPLLAEEPLKVEPAAAELALLAKAVDKAGKAVRAVLDTNRASQLTRLQASISQRLDLTPATTRLQNLRSVCSSSSGPGSLGLSRQDTSAAASALLAALEKLVEPEQGALLMPQQQDAQAQVAEAQRDLAGEVDKVVSEARATKTQEVEAAARAVEVSHIVRSAMTPSQWSPTSPLGAKLALMELLLTELEGSASRSEPSVPDLAGAARKLAPMVKITDTAAAAHVHELTKALGSSDVSTLPGASSELRAALVQAVEPQLPPSPAETLKAVGEAEQAAVGGTGPDAAVSALVSGMFRRVVAGIAQSGVAGYVDRQAIVSSIQEEAARRREVHKQGVSEKMEAELASLAKTTQSKVLEARLESAGSVPSAARIATVAAYIKDVSLPKGKATGGAILTEAAAGAAKALKALDTAQDLAASGPGAADVVAEAKALCEQVLLTGDVAAKLNLGSGVASLLTRLGEYLDNLGPFKPAVALPPKPQTEGDETQGDGETEVPGPDDAKVAEASGLVRMLLQDGLVLLELQPSDYRRLTLLRETVEAAQAAGSDAMMMNRHVTTLKEVVGNLGPVMGTIEAKIASIADEDAKARLSSLKQAALSLFQSLQAFIALEMQTRAGAEKDLKSMRDIVAGIKLDKSSSALERVLEQLNTFNEHAAGVVNAVTNLEGSEEAVSEVMVAEEGVDRLVPQVKSYDQYVRLREHTLGATVGDPSFGIEEGADIELPPVEELQTAHSEDTVFIDMYGQELQQVSDWMMDGYRVVARGQVALVLIAGAIDGEEVRCTRDTGLPSTKSMLQLYAERLIRLQQLATEAVHGNGAGVVRPIDWYIMTSQKALGPTKAFLADNAFFGLHASQVHVFAADVSPPTLTEDLKIVMSQAKPGRMLRTATSSGDVFTAMRAAGMLKRLYASGVKCVEVQSLEDNIMARPADPVFLGCCRSVSLDCAAKAADPDHLMPCYETYAQLMTLAKTAQDFGKLVPAIGTYFFSMAYIKQLDALLQREPLALYRLTPAANIPQKGSATKTSGYMLTRHLSDLIIQHVVPGTQRGLVFIESEDEFNPVWGNPPLYTPETPTAAVDELLLTHTRWVENCGGIVGDKPAQSEEGQEDGQEAAGEGKDSKPQNQGTRSVVEVSPLVSYAGEHMDELGLEGRHFPEAYDLDLQGYGPRPGRTLVTPPPVLLGPFALAFLGLSMLKVLAKLQAQ